MIHIQCDLRKNGYIQTAWIEDKNLEVGKTVELKFGEGIREGDWVIEKMYGRAELSEINKDSYKSHRSRTDI
jgi:hypothetical protein